MSRRGPATGLVGVRRCAVQIRHRRWSGLDTISRTPLRNPAECVAARGRDACHQAVTSKPRCTDNSLRTRPRRKRASCHPSQQRQHACCGCHLHRRGARCGCSDQGFRRQEHTGTHEDFHLRSGAHLGHSLLRRRTTDSGKLSGSESFDCGRCAGRKSSRSSTVTLFDDAPTEVYAAVREAWNGEPPNHRAR